MTRHQILRQVIELQGGPADRDAQRQLQAQVQRLWRDHLLPAIGRACDQASPAGQRLRIERLVLDLGAQPWLAHPQHDEQPDADGPEALARQTEALLLQRLTELAQASPSSVGEGAGPPAALELLDEFVHSGCLPWWADLQAPAPLALACVELARALRRPGAGALARSSLRLWSDMAWQRLAAAVDDAALAALLAALLEPSAGGLHDGPHDGPAWQQWVQGHLQACLQVHAAVRPPVALLRRRLWQRLFTDALAGHGSSSTQALAQSSLARVALSLGLPLQDWRAAARLQPGVAAGPADDAPRPRPGQARVQAWRAWLGRCDLGHEAAAVAALHALLQALQALPSAVEAKLPWPPETPAQELQPPNQALPVDQAAQRLAPVLVADARLAQAWAGFRRHLRPSHTSGQALGQARGQVQAGPAGPQMAAGAQHRDAFLAASDELERLAVGNAGLVWLWPFLVTAFDRLGWLAPVSPGSSADSSAGASAAASRGFARTAWAERAALWLHALACGPTPAPDPPDADFAHAESGLVPEHRLPLCKLLCGLPPQHALCVDEPLTGVELDEAEAVLAAMVLRAPILRGLSAAGLRGSFLLRPGLLCVRDGHWLLRAERASWDLVLDRVPWSVGLLRLPWMAQPLQVEW